MKTLFKNWKGRKGLVDDTEFDGEALESPPPLAATGAVEASGCEDAFEISIVLQKVRAHRRRSMEPSPLERLVLRNELLPSLETDNDDAEAQSHFRRGEDRADAVQLESFRPRRRSMEARINPGDLEQFISGKVSPTILPTVVDMARGGTASGKLPRTPPDAPYPARKVLSSDFKSSEDDDSSQLLLKEMMRRRKGDALASSRDPSKGMGAGSLSDQARSPTKLQASKDALEQLQQQSPRIGLGSRPLRKKTNSHGVWHDLVDSNVLRNDSSTPCTSESESESLSSPSVGRPPRNASLMKHSRLPQARRVASDGDSDLSSPSRASPLLPLDSKSSGWSEASSPSSREKSRRTSSFSQRPSKLQHSSNSSELEETPKGVATRSRSHGEVGLDIDDDMARFLPQRPRRRSVEMNTDEVAAIVSRGRSRDRRRSVELVSAALGDGSSPQSSDMRRQATGQSSEASPDSILSKNSDFSRRSSFAEDASPHWSTSPSRGVEARKTATLRPSGTVVTAIAEDVDRPQYQQPRDAHKGSDHLDIGTGSRKDPLDVLGLGRYDCESPKLKMEMEENRLKLEARLQRLKGEKASQDACSGGDPGNSLRLQPRQQRPRRRSVEVVRQVAGDSDEDHQGQKEVLNGALDWTPSKGLRDTDTSHLSNSAAAAEEPTSVRRLQRRRSVSDMCRAEQVSPSVSRELPNVSQQPLYSRAPEAPILQRPSEDIREKYAVNASQELGRGRFGVIRVCVSRETGQKFACKSISKGKLQRWQDVEDIRTEVVVMEMLRGYPHVVQLQDTFEDANHVHLVMELCEGGELFDRITAKRRYSEGKAAALVRTLATVLRNCHALNIMHRDLKPENILLLRKDDDAAIKVIDFGVSVIVRPGHLLEDVVGTPNYLAPEVLQGCYSIEGDIWSAGVVLYILLCGSPPFWAINQNDGALELMRSKSLDLSGGVWDGISPPAKNLVRRMLTLDPYMRITADQILTHPWVTS